MIRRCLFTFGLTAVLVGVVGTALSAAQGGLPEAPEHFRVTEFADVGDLIYGFYRNPTAVSVGPDGRVYVALLGGRIYAFEDVDGDDQQDAYQLFASGVNYPTDMGWLDGALYVVTRGEVRRLEDLDADGVADSNQLFIGDLPETVRSLAFDSQRRIYLGVAAACDNCTPDDPRMGSVLRLAGSEPYTPTLYAIGLRDPEGLAFYPGTDDLFAPDSGRGDLGPDVPPDELNLVRYGEHYGWPHCWEGGSDPGWELFCTWSIPPVALFPAHSVPAGLVFHDGRGVPPILANNALVPLQAMGQAYRLAVTPDGADGYTASGEPFATGFDAPTDVAVGPDGAIYVADYDARKIYSIRALPDLAGSRKRAATVATAPGERLSYTLSVEVVGPTTTFALTDTIPPSTTYVAGSLWASAGAITWTGGTVHWQGTISANTTLTASFAVEVDATTPTHTVILNTAILAGEGDPASPYTLQAIAIVNPSQGYLPIILRD